MKKIILLFVFACSLNVLTYSQSILSTLSLDGTFVEGIIGVDNNVEIIDLFGYEVSADFYIEDSQGAQVELFSDNDNSDGFSWSIDMGDLPQDSYTLIVDFFDDNGDILIDARIEQALNIIPKPQWLIDGSVSDVIVNGNVISFIGSSAVSSYEYTIPNDIKGMGGEPLNIFGNLVFYSEYDYTNNPISPIIQEEAAEIEINILGLGEFSSFTNEIPLSDGFFDQYYQLTIFSTDSISTDKLELKVPKIKFPVAGFTVSVDAGLNLWGTLKGQVVMGEENGEWGYIDNGGQRTEIGGVLTGEAFVRGEVSILFGSAKANASINGKARLGIGFDYTSIPSNSFNEKSGGDISLSGEVCVKSIFIDGCYISDNWYSDYFGDTTILKSISDDHFFNTQSITFRDTGALVLPEYSPQPTFATKDDKLYTVWLEQDEDLAYLLFSKLNSAGTSFSEEKIVCDVSSAISNPKVAILPNGSAIITWSQSRFTASNLPINTDINELVQSQDIWFAIYDIATDVIYEPQKLSDDDAGLQSGRAEGEAFICVGDGNSAIITWVASDLLEQTSDIWFTHLTEETGTWFMTTPEKLDELDGANFNVQVVSTGDDSALAIWMNDPDSDEDSYNTNLLYSEWDGSSWTQPAVLVTNNDSIKLKELSISSNYGYTALSWTGTAIIEDNKFENRIDVLIYDEVLDDWDLSSEFNDFDENYDFLKPNVSISNTGKATVTYQVIDMFADTNFISNGALNVFVKDLSSSSIDWQQIANNPILCDTNAFIWELTTGFSAEDKFYVLTQEYNDNGVVMNPLNGVKFGDPELSMVLRGVKVNDNLTISDIVEPIDLPLGIVKHQNPSNFKFVNFYPNPFSENTVIEFHLYENSNVQLEIYDFLGNQVTQLVDKNLNAGIYKTIFNAGDLPNGVYFSKLTVDGKNAFGKLVLTR